MTTPEDTLLRLPFDQYGRYSLIREIVNALRPHLGMRLSVLDVGGLAVTRRGETILPAQLFLPDDDVTVLDQPMCELSGYVRGDGRGIAYPDRSFDLVVSCDVLEHVPSTDRATFWGELLRVARHGVILAAPFNEPTTSAAEALLQSYIQVELGVTQPQLAEHAQYGLPECKLTAALLDSLDRAYRVYPTGYVHAWLTMMLAKHTRLFSDLDLHDQLDTYYNRFLSASERREPAYRYVWVVETDAHQGWLDSVDAAITPTLTQGDAPEACWRELGIWAAQLHGLRLATDQAARLEALQAALSHRDAEMAVMRATLAQREAQIVDLERRSSWLEAQSHAARNALAAVEQGMILRLLRRLRRQT